jgi:hypothetical protein
MILSTLDPAWKKIGSGRRGILHGNALTGTFTLNEIKIRINKIVLHRKGNQSTISRILACDSINSD